MSILILTSVYIQSVFTLRSSVSSLWFRKKRIPLSTRTSYTAWYFPNAELGIAAGEPSFSGWKIAWLSITNSCAFTPALQKANGESLCGRTVVAPLDHASWEWLSFLLLLYAINISTVVPWHINLHLILNRDAYRFGMMRQLVIAETKPCALWCWMWEQSFTLGVTIFHPRGGNLLLAQHHIQGLGMPIYEKMQIFGHSPS